MTQEVDEAENDSFSPSGCECNDFEDKTVVEAVDKIEDLLSLLLRLLVPAAWGSKIV